MIKGYRSLTTKERGQDVIQKVCYVRKEKYLDVYPTQYPSTYNYVLCTDRERIG